MNRRLSSLILVLVLSAAPVAARTDLPSGFVYLRDVAPTIAQDMRYATPDNFTGRPVPGYQASECVLRREAAQALARVAADLATAHDPEKWEPVFGQDHAPTKNVQLGLKVYDCYRPARAARAFWRWSQDARAGGAKRFYPHVPKRELFARGYIAAHSRHSEGIAVDLTLVALPAARAPAYDARKTYGACTAPAGERAPDTSLDMGTGFDCLDPKSATRSAAVTPEQHRLRLTLRSVMERHGFRNYFREWWHYEYRNAPRRTYDFPIEAR